VPASESSSDDRSVTRGAGEDPVTLVTAVSAMLRLDVDQRA
jgi:hypothetical protein